MQKQFKKRVTYLALATAIVAGGISAAQAAPIAADVVFIVDESGSMSGEHAWLGGMIGSLEAELTAAGVGVSESNNYGLIGYGATGTHTSAGSGGHAHTVGGGQWGSAAQLATATSGLVASGGFEDGYQAIDYFFDNYTIDANHALNIVLITDEDRDVLDGSLSYASILAEIQSHGGLLNAVIDCGFAGSGGAPGSAIGIDSGNNAYLADGAGGYTTTGGGHQSGGCFGTSYANYGQMALATGGAAWDLGILRSGGLNATSFTNAFVDIKVQEIVTIPEPTTLALLGMGLIGFGAISSRRKQSAT